MLTNIATVCKQSALVSQIILQVDTEIRLRQEQTLHTCKNCVYFSGNEYLMCAVHPEGVGVEEWEVNNCIDWEFNNQEVVL